MTAQTFDKIDTHGLNVHDIAFLKYLNVVLTHGGKFAYTSIMNYNEICDCDNGFLCEHRLQYVANYLKKMQ